MNRRPAVVRAMLAALGVALVLLQVRLWVSEHGLSEVRRLGREVALQRRENAGLDDRNRRLQAEVRDLKRGFAALEERARSDLGLVQPDETFFVLGGGVEPGAD